MARQKKHFLINLLLGGAILLSMPMPTQAVVSQKAKTIWSRIESDPDLLNRMLGLLEMCEHNYEMSLDEAIELALGYFKNKMKKHEPHEALNGDKWEERRVKYNSYVSRCIDLLVGIDKKKSEKETVAPISPEVARLADELIQGLKFVDSSSGNHVSVEGGKQKLEILKQNNIFKTILKDTYAHEGVSHQKHRVSQQGPSEASSHPAEQASMVWRAQTAQGEESSDDEVRRRGSKRRKKHQVIESDTELAEHSDAEEVEGVAVVQNDFAGESEDGDVYHLNFPRYERNKVGSGQRFDRVPVGAKQRMRDIYREISTRQEPKWEQISRRLKEEGLNYSGKAVSHHLTKEGVHCPVPRNEWTDNEQEKLQQLLLEKRPTNFSDFSREVAHQFPSRGENAVYKQLVKYRSSDAQQVPWLTSNAYSEQERERIESAYNEERTTAQRLGVNMISKQALAEKLAQVLEGRTVGSLEYFLTPYYEKIRNEGVGPYYSQKQKDALIAAYEQARLNDPNQMVSPNILAKDIHGKGTLLGRSENAIEIELRKIIKRKNLNWGDPWPEEEAARHSEDDDAEQEDSDNESGRAFRQ